MTVQPAKGWALVAWDGKQAGTHEATVLLAPTHQRAQMGDLRGTVIAVGPPGVVYDPERDPEGTYKAADFEPGQRVIFEWPTHDGPDFGALQDNEYFVRVDSVVAVLEDE